MSILSSQQYQRPTVEGKMAEFRLPDGKAIRGKIIWSPCATGDSWIIEDEQTPDLKIYIQNFLYMFLFPEED